MYELKFVKKRKRRIAAAILGLFSSAGIGAFAIVAFLGRYVGTFTVTLDTGSVELSLSQDKAFTEPTTVLTINYLPPYQEWTYSQIVDKEDILDSEDTDYLEGAVFQKEEDTDTEVPICLNFFKYTFYVKNVGATTARYNVNVNIIENKPDEESGRYLTQTLRVAIYENSVDLNDDTTTHYSKVYAKAKDESPNYDEDGNKTFKEYISISPEKADASNRCYGLAEEFLSDSKIATLSVSDFKHDDIKRYTLITWLEGYDPESNNNKTAPKGASIKLGVEINAYEN